MSLKNYEKRSSLIVWLIHMLVMFFFFVIAQVYVCSAGCRVYKGHLQNELMSDKNFSEIFKW